MNQSDLIAYEFERLQQSERKFKRLVILLFVANTLQWLAFVL